MKKTKKILKWLLIFCLLLVVVLFASGYYFLKTNDGLKRAIALANDYSGYEVSADSIDGDLLNRTELTNFRVKGSDLEFNSEKIVLDWQSGALLKRDLVVKAVTVNNATLVLNSKDDTPEPESEPFSLSDIDLPFDVKLEDVQINNLTIKSPLPEGAETGANDIVIDQITLGMHYVGQKAVVDKLTFIGMDTHLNLTGEVVTKGDFPLHLQSDTNYDNQALGREILNLTLDGELKKDLTVAVDGKGLSDFRLDGTVSSVLAQPRFDTQLSLQRVDTDSLGLFDTSLNAQLAVKGEMTDKLMVNVGGEAFYDSPNTDKVKLTLNADFDGERVDLSHLDVDLLTANQQLTGQGSYTLATQAIDVKLNSEALFWPQNSAEPSVALTQTGASITGYLDDYHLDIKTRVKSAATGEMPLSLSADGDLSSAKAFNLLAELDGQPLSVSGNATWQPAIAYQVQIKADEFSPQGQIPGVKNLDITLDGDDTNYHAKGGVYLYADSIPASDITLDINATPEKLANADILMKTLGGTLDIKAQGDLAPLNLTATAKAKNIQPQTFYPDISGNINHDIRLSAQQDGENLTAEAVIESLSGTLQKFPLTGGGRVRFEQAQNRINVQGLSVNLAGNKIDADGVLSLDNERGVSDLTADIDAPQLKRLLPDLSGAVTAHVVAKGSLATPELQAKINGKNIAYQDNHIQSIDSVANVSLAKDTIALDANIAGIKSGANEISQATATVDGTFAAHTLNIDIQSAKASTIPAVQLSGKGGLNKDTMTWTGVLNALNLDNDMLGKWGLKQPANLTLSSGNVAVNQLCLQQSPASLCADGTMKNDNGKFVVTLDTLKTQTFKSLMPAAVDVDTTLSGKVNIALNGSKPQVSGKISADGGQLSLNTASGGLKSKIKQFDVGILLKNQRLESVVHSDFSRLGKVDIAAELPNISKGNLKANIKIDNKSLKFIEDLVPQLNDVSGNLSGDMTLSGDPTRALKVAGKITLHETNFNVPEYGSEIRDLTLDIYAKDGNKIGFKGAAKAGEGDFNIDGEINPATQRGEINLKGENFQAANSQKLQVTISPDIQVDFADTIKVRGEVLVPKALIVPESTTSKVTVSEDVVLPHEKDAPKKASSSPVDVELSVKLGDDVRVASADIETRLHGGIKINAKPGKAPKAAGAIEVETGELRIYGQMLNIERGRVIFSNGPIANPSLDIRTTRTLDDYDVTVGANVLGTVSKPEISLFSTPSMADSSILSYLLFGKPPSSDSFGTTALLQTGGVVGANALARDLRSSLGLDVLDFSLTGMEAGKNLSKKMYVGMKSNFFDAINEFLFDYKISGRTRIESAISTEEISVDLIKVIETD